MGFSDTLSGLATGSGSTVDLTSGADSTTGSGSDVDLASGSTVGSDSATGSDFA